MVFDDFDDIDLTPEQPEEPEKKEKDKADIDEVAKSLGGGESEQPEEPALPSDDEFTIPEIDESMSLDTDSLEEGEPEPPASQIEKDDSAADPGDISLEGLDTEEPVIEEGSQDKVESASEDIQVSGGEPQESAGDISLDGMDSGEEPAPVESETDESSTETESDSGLDLEETDLSAISFDDEDFSLDSSEEEKEEEQIDEIDESSFVIDGTEGPEPAGSPDIEPAGQEQELISESDVDISGPEDIIDEVIEDDSGEDLPEEEIPVPGTEDQQETGGAAAESGVWEEGFAEEEAPGKDDDAEKKKKKKLIPVIVLVLLVAGGGYYIYNSLFSKPAPPPKTPVRAAAPKAPAKPVVTNKYIYPDSDNVLEDKNEGVSTYIYSTKAGVGALYDFYKSRMSGMKYDTSQDDYSAGGKNAHIVYTKGNSVVAVVLRDRGDNRSVVLSYVE